MRIIVFFDLPMQTGENIKEYTKFRKFLIKEGFLMLQQSVYSKLAINNTTTLSVMNKLRKNKPSYGLIQTLTITEKQFASIENIVGEKTFCEINDTQRLVVL